MRSLQKQWAPIEFTLFELGANGCWAVLGGWSVGRSRERGVILCIVCCCSGFPRKRRWQKSRTRAGIKLGLLQHMKCMRWELTVAAVMGLSLHTQHGAPRQNLCLQPCLLWLRKQQRSQYSSFRNDIYLSAATTLLSRLQSFPYQLGTDLKLIYHLFSCSGKAEHPCACSCSKIIEISSEIVRCLRAISTTLLVCWFVCLIVPFTSRIQLQHVFSGFTNIVEAKPYFIAPRNFLTDRERDF